MTQLAQPGADMNDLRAKITMERARLSKSNADISSYNDAISMISRYVDLAAGVRVFARWDAAVRRIRPDRCQPRKHQ